MRRQLKMNKHRVLFYHRFYCRNGGENFHISKKKLINYSAQLVLFIFQWYFVIIIR